jgi:hypothetical protein
MATWSPDRLISIAARPAWLRLPNELDGWHVPHHSILAPPEHIAGKSVEQVRRQHSLPLYPFNPTAHRMQPARAQSEIEVVSFTLHILEIMGEIRFDRQ